VKRAAGLLAFACTLLAAGSSDAAVDAIDDAGMRVVLPGSARRVISLSPALTELVFAAGGGDRLVGVDSASDYPATARALPRVGDAAGIDLERIVGLRADLILSWLSGNKPADIARLRELAFPIFASEPRKLDDVPRTLRALGSLLGTQETAREQAAAFASRLTRLREGNAGKRTLSVFVEIWHQPLMTVNGEHLVSDVLRLCGARNVFAEQAALAGPVSVESVIAAQPEVILSATGFAEDSTSWNRFASVPAVRAGHVWAADPDGLTRATPRILEEAQRVCEHIAQARE
jgi:iron complex transport system substrate-binding protein